MTSQMSLISRFIPRSSNGQVHPAVKVAGAAATAGAVTWLAIATPFVGGFEGYSGKPYRDSVGVLTICYGATAADHVDFSKTYTKAECEQMLGTDLQKYEAQIRPCIPKIDAVALEVIRELAYRHGLL